MIPYIPHWLWSIWAGALGIVILGYVVLESAALINGFKSHDTLSEVVWEHGHIPGVVWFLGGGMLILTTIWVVLHLAKGKWGF